MLERLPEEILENIIFLSLSNSHSTVPPPPCSLRPAWHTRPSYHLAILLTSHRFLRIATHHVYNSIHLATRTKAQLLLRSLESNTALAPHIQSLTIRGVWPEGGLIMGLCKGAVRYLDINLEQFSEVGLVDTEYGEGLSELVGVRHLTVRKPYNVYQSLPRLRYIVVALARAIEGWSELETANIAFRLSDDTPTSPILSSTPVFASFSVYPPSAPARTTTTLNPPTPPQHGPIGPTTQLSSALACAPNLHTFTTQLPSVWNIAILGISANPRLERIILSDRSYESPFLQNMFNPCLPARSFNLHHPPAAQGAGIAGTGLFLMEARKHPRLSELIRTGTCITRGRAYTYALGSPRLGSRGSVNLEDDDGEGGTRMETENGIVGGGRGAGLGLNWG